MNILNSIFKGRVKHIEPGLKAMFIDIGLKNNAFLHFWDALPAVLDGGIELVSRHGRKQQRRITVADVLKTLKVGAEVLVQVTKEPNNSKGPRVTTNINIHGDCLLLLPYNNQCGVSKKIVDVNESARLRAILKDLELPEDMGLLIKAEGQGRSARYYESALHLLIDYWKEIEETMNTKPAPCCVLREPDIITKIIQNRSEFL